MKSKAARADSPYLICHMERENLGLVCAFEISKLNPSDTLTPTRPHLLIFPKPSSNGEPSIQL